MVREQYCSRKSSRVSVDGSGGAIASGERAQLLRQRCSSTLRKDPRTTWAGRGAMCGGRYSFGKSAESESSS